MEMFGVRLIEQFRRGDLKPFGFEADHVRTNERGRLAWIERAIPNEVNDYSERRLYTRRYTDEVMAALRRAGYDVYQLEIGERYDVEERKHIAYGVVGCYGPTERRDAQR